MTNRLIIGESPETIKNIYDKLIYWNEREVFSDLEMEISLGKKSMKTSKGEPNKALVDSIVDAIVRKRKRNKDSLTLQTVKSVLTSHGFNIPFTEEIQKVSNFLVRYLCKSIEVSFSYRSE